MLGSSVDGGRFISWGCVSDSSTDDKSPTRRATVRSFLLIVSSPVLKSRLYRKYKPSGIRRGENWWSKEIPWKTRYTWPQVRSIFTELALRGSSNFMASHCRLACSALNNSSNSKKIWIFLKTYSLSSFLHFSSLSKLMLDEELSKYGTLAWGRRCFNFKVTLCPKPWWKKTAD